MSDAGVKPTPDSYRKIWEAIAMIPIGAVANYGQIAEIAGLPGRARLVGTALRHTPDDMQLPWHRVLRSNGQLAFPEGSASFDEQRARLASEGVLMSGGRVDLKRYRWQPSLDELMWKPMF